MTTGKVVHLNRYHHFTELMRDPRIEAQLLRFRSNYDRSTQAILVMQPAERRSDRLFLFLHGMDGDCGDAVIVRDLVANEAATVVAPGGRGPSWVSDAWFADVQQVIRRYRGQFDRFYLIGVSMGGTQALSLAGTLPDALRQSLSGVIALIPGADLAAILEHSTNDRVRATLRAAIGENPAPVRARNPREAMKDYKQGLPFVIVYNEDDTLLRSRALQPFIALLREGGHPVATFSTPGEHDFTPANLDYSELMRSLGSDGTFRALPTLR